MASRGIWRGLIGVVLYLGAALAASGAEACLGPSADWDLKSKGLPGFVVHAEPERFSDASWPADLKAAAPLNFVEIKTPEGKAIAILRSLRDPSRAYARLPDGSFRALPQDTAVAATPAAPAGVELQSHPAAGESGTEALAPIIEMANPGLYRHDILLRDGEGRLTSAIEVDECFPHGAKRNLAEYRGSRECGITVFSLVHPFADAPGLAELRDQVKALPRRERGVHVTRIDQIVADLPKSYDSSPEDYYKALMAQVRAPGTYGPWTSTTFPKTGFRHSAVELRATDRAGAKEPYLGKIDPGTWLVVAVSRGIQVRGGGASPNGGGSAQKFCHGFAIPAGTTN